MDKIRQWSQSSAGQIAKVYTFILTIVIVLIGVALIVTVGYQLVQSRIVEAKGLMNSLQESIIDDKPDWERWRDVSAIDTQDTYVKVSFTKNGQSRVYYSNGTQKFVQGNPRPKTVFRSIQYKKDQKLFYYQSKTSAGVHYETWTSFHSVLHIFHLIFDILLIVMALGLILGVILIFILSKKLNQSLEHLTKATHTIVETRDQNQDVQIPIPKGPKEVQDLSLEFNRLLKQLNQQAQREHQFVSDASHELRTPLAAIRGHVQLIDRHGIQHPEVLQKSFHVIDNESLRMQKLVENLLRLSRMENTKISKENFDISKLVTQVVEAYQNEISQEIICQIQANVQVFGNSENIQQIVIALLNNASKYSDSETKIGVNVCKKENVEITICDEGIGIPEGEQRKIFQRFYRVDKSRSQDIPGTGLGLAIVKELLDLNQGEIKVLNRRPKGSMFIVTLPSSKSEF